MKKIKTYEEFWPYYLKQHSKPATIVWHVTGVLLGSLWALTAFFDGRPLHIPLGLVIGYGLAWYSHCFIEHNKPATFEYPLWSLISDFRMTYLILTKKLSIR